MSRFPPNSRGFFPPSRRLVEEMDHDSGQIKTKQKKLSLHAALEGRECVCYDGANIFIEMLVAEEPLAFHCVMDKP